jgi:pimeloyl-ACP methyl ester carboxylesterase
VKRRWKILIGLLVALAIFLAVNASITGNQTKEAEVTVEGGQILELSRGAVQVTDTGEPASPTPGQPIVLLHCYACSLHWFDAIEPLLAERHRVIRIDLLGFGGSEKPESGYEIPAQAAMVAEAMNQLGVQGALVAGNSMGGSVTASLAEQASQLVDRAVVIDAAPNHDDYGDGLPFLARLTYVPVLGEALWRITPDFAIRDSYAEAFAPGFDVEEGFPDPNQVVRDYNAMTYTSYDSAPARSDDFVNELPLDERFKRTPVPLMVIFGSEDQIIDAEAAIEGFSDVPGVQTEIVEGAGHAPQVEKPQEVATLLEGFSIEAEVLESEPEPKKKAKKKQKGKQRDGAKGDENGTAKRERSTRGKRRANRRQARNR